MTIILTNTARFLFSLAHTVIITDALINIKNKYTKPKSTMHNDNKSTYDQDHKLLAESEAEREDQPTDYEIAETVMETLLSESKTKHKPNTMNERQPTHQDILDRISSVEEMLLTAANQLNDHNNRISNLEQLVQTPKKAFDKIQGHTNRFLNKVQKNLKEETVWIVFKDKDKQIRNIRVSMDKKWKNIPLSRVEEFTQELDKTISDYLEENDGTRIYYELVEFTWKSEFKTV